MERPLARSVIADDMTLAGYRVLVRYQSLKAYWAARVQLRCADAHFGAESVSEAIGEPRRAVAVYAGGVDELHETVGSCVILGHDGVGMVRSVTVDVGNGLVDVGDDLDG